MNSGTWPPVVKWYDDEGREVSSGPGTASGNTVRQETLRTATEQMQGKRFRCHTSYSISKKIDTNTATHKFSIFSPTYENDEYIRIISVDCKY